MCRCDDSIKGATCKKCQDKDKHPGGRGTVITDSVVVKLETAFSIGANITNACDFANVSRDAYYVRLDKDPEFHDKMEAAKNKLVLKALKSVESLLDDKHPTVTMDFMKKYFNKIWGDKLEIAGDPNNPIFPNVKIYIPDNDRDKATKRSTRKIYVHVC